MSHESKISISKLLPPVGDIEGRPFWSVMIPTYNPKQEHLIEALQSVLRQDPGPARMQIEVVDDCSTDVNVLDVVNHMGRGRVSFYRNSENLGLAGCWNMCLTRARGVWIHLLHQDDYVLPDFYRTLEMAERLHPDLALLASRSFFIDQDGIITGVTPRVKNLECGGRMSDAFFYGLPLQCPGVAVKREFYEKHGVFRDDFKSVLDWEMWTRILDMNDGFLSPNVLSCYRASKDHETARLHRSGRVFDDIGRLSKYFAKRYKTFDHALAKRRLCELALKGARRFTEEGDMEAAGINLRYWNQNASLAMKVRHKLRVITGRL